MKEKKFNTKIAHLVSIQTTRTKVTIGVFEDYGDAIQFAHENGDNVVVEDVNWFPKRRQRKQKQVVEQEKPDYKEMLARAAFPATVIPEDKE